MLTMIRSFLCLDVLKNLQNYYSKTNYSKCYLNSMFKVLHTIHRILKTKQKTVWKGNIWTKNQRLTFVPQTLENVKLKYFGDVDVKTHCLTLSIRRRMWFTYRFGWYFLLFFFCLVRCSERFFFRGFPFFFDVAKIQNDLSDKRCQCIKRNECDLFSR